jgi:hypothetical protein
MKRQLLTPNWTIRSHVRAPGLPLKFRARELRQGEPDGGGRLVGVEFPPKALADHLGRAER